MRKLLTLAVLAGATAVAPLQLTWAQGPNNNQAPTDRSLYFSDADLQAIMKKQPAGFSTRLFNASTSAPPSSAWLSRTSRTPTASGARCS
jgi:hypothetical protein